MANEYFEVQTYADVQQIDHRKETNIVMNDQIEQQNNNMEVISNQLDNIVTTLDSGVSNNINLTEITDKIDEIDTTVITAQTEDILITVQKQNNEIEALKEQNENLENKLDLILSKLEEM